MRSYSFWSLLAILTLAVGVRAEDTYTIKLKRAPDVGKANKVTSTDTTSTSIKVAFPATGQEVQKKQAEREEAVYTVSVLEKGDERPNKYKRTYETATRTRDGKAETRSYQGRTLIFEKKGDKYTVTSEEDKPISKEDLADLTRSANRSTAGIAELFLPSKSIKVGDTWKIEGKKIAELFPGDPDPERSGGEGKLTKVYKKDGHRFGVLTHPFEGGCFCPYSMGRDARVHLRRQGGESCSWGKSLSALPTAAP